MKRILFACLLLTATCTVSFVHKATAQTTIIPVTLTDFTTKINLLDSYIAAGNMTAAQSTWTDVHNMMLTIFAVSKQSIQNATSPSDKSNHMTILQNQWDIYRVAMQLKENLAANRAPLHTQLVAFGATIY